jgi:mono/diheme cytochrome c family protein
MRAPLVAVFVTVACAEVVFAQGAELGQTEYMTSCATCHGPTGKGNGPVSEALNKAPADVTKLSEANRGIFPVSRVYDAIDGRSVTRAHGTRDMPVWGETYMAQLRYPGSTLSQEAIDAAVRARILALIEHLSTLQGK